MISEFYRSRILKAKSFVLPFLLLIHKIVAAQAQPTTDFLSSFDLPSPQSYGVGQVSGAPLNLFNGQIQPRIELYKKELKDLDISLKLDYVGGGGIKWEDPGSIVGKGWFLNLGGAIIRNRRGIPDDYKNSTANSSGEVTSEFNGVLFNTGVSQRPDGETRISGSDILYKYDVGLADSQRDVFEFNFLGRAGKFYIGNDKSIHIVPEMSIKIIPTFSQKNELSTQISSFKIIDEAGTTYFFDDIEESEIIKNYFVSYWDPYLFYNKVYASGWYLTRIETAHKDEIISFSYNKKPFDDYYSGLCYSHFVDHSDAPYLNRLSCFDLDHTNVSELVPAAITFSDGTKIEFA
ncbi:hypothetical protein, partial [Pararcticibacter amylolyticus]|uniref:hypothetical protein n=1 Tax=Pararcticibacter amylolyticus TaxID=2173175 RepID=UPI00130487E9